MHHGYHIDDRQTRMQFFWFLLNEVTFLSRGAKFPGCTLENETVDVSTTFRVAMNFYSRF